MNRRNMPNNTAILPSQWPHRVGVLLAVVVFPLIWVGGLVTTTQAGMAVPDWPGTYGYNLLFYPWYDWFFGPWDLFVEHGHRLLGSLAGLISIVLLIVSFATKQTSTVRRFAILLLILVIGQGVLGGVRVLIDARLFALIHGCTGPLYFGFVVAFCVVTSRWWLTAASQFLERVRPKSVAHSAWLFAGIAYLQLVVGAVIRHYPADLLPSGFLHTVYLHLTLAGLLAVLTFFHTWRVHLVSPPEEGLRGSMRWLSALIGVQILLGLSTWVVKYGFPVWAADWSVVQSFVIPHRSFWQTVVITGHAATGSLILAFWTKQAVRATRWSRQSGEAQTRAERWVVAS